MSVVEEKIQTAVADPPFQFLFIDRESALIPFLHRHPAHCLLHPLVQPQLPEGVFLSWILLCRLAGRLDFIHPHRDVQGRVGFLPDLRISPVITLICPIDHRVKSRVDLSAFQDILCLLVRLIADGVGICPRCGDIKEQGLHPCVTAAFCHDIKQSPVRSRVQFIIDHPMDVESMLGIGFRTEYLVKGVGRQVDDPFLGCQNLHPLGKRRTHPHHIRRDIKHNRRLLPV